jgi:Ca2+-binding EF-hand superfamily protein
MSKKILLIAGVLLAAGSVAAISAPYFRGGHMRPGAIFGDMGEDAGPMRARLGERLKAMDADKDGAVTLEEFLARRNRVFARFDKNNDGIVDAAEFEAATKESSDYWIKRFIKRFDADRDGKISKDEFARARRERFAMRDLNDDGRIGLEDMPPGVRRRMADRAKDGPEAKDGAKDGKEATKERGPFTLDRLLGRIDRQFARFDKNGDGFIDANDLAAVAAERATYAAQRFFKRFDADRDGKVTREEFNRFAKQRFANLDLDDDGKITEADLPPMMRGQGFLK